MNSEFDVRLGLSYSLGIYLAVNALPDCALVVDGKDCVVQKAIQIRGNHDWSSTLLSSDGAHRILTTHAMHEEVWKGRDDDVERVLRYTVHREDVTTVMLCAMRMASVTDPPYDLIVDKVVQDTGTDKPMVLLPTRSMREDWLSGYADTLSQLAKELELVDSQVDTERPRVAIVGYLMDRNEQDHHANIRELRRLVEALGAEVVSVWLCGEPVCHLREAGRAQLVVSLPYARKAAKTIARRTGAKLVETGLPMGLEGTSQWLRQIAGALERPDDAERVIEAELREVAPRLEGVVPMLLVNQSMAFAGDPYLMRAFIAFAHELGVRVPFRMIFAPEDESYRDLLEDTLDDPVAIVDPREGQSKDAFDKIVAEREVILLVGNTYAIADLKPKIAAYELGFPSFHRHALTEQPHLGYQGCLSLIARMTECSLMHRLLHSE